MYIILPEPPSLNEYYIVQKRGKFHAKVVSKKGMMYHREIAQLKQLLRIPTFTGDLSMTLECFPYSKNSRDIDNYYKCLNDSLQAAGIIENDNNIRWQLGKMQCPNRGLPCVIIRIEKMEFYPKSLDKRIEEIESLGDTIIGKSVFYAKTGRPHPDRRGR